MGVPTSKVGYTPAMPRMEDHEFHKGHVVALDKKNLQELQCTQCTAGLSCDRMITEYTRYDQCYVLLNLCPSKSRDDTTTQDYALCHTGRRHPDAHGFRRLTQRLRQTGRLTPTALVNSTAKSGFGPRWKNFSGSPQGGPTLYHVTKSETLTLGFRVTWAWSVRFNSYKRQIMILPRKIKTYATLSGPGNLYRLLPPSPSLAGTACEGRLPWTVRVPENEGP